MRVSFLATVLLLGYLGAKAQQIQLPAELKSFVLKGYEFYDFAKGDMNNDKLQDYLLVLKIKGEDTMTYDNPHWDADRPLLLILRQTDGSLKLQDRNDKLILCRQCGGVMGDPYQGLTIKPGQFNASFYGGSSWRWSEGFTFKYDALKKDWFLNEHNSSSFNAGDPEKTEDQAVIRRTEIGDLSFHDFVPEYNQDSSTWKVSAAKTYFYGSPQLGSRPKKAYLVKGNTVQSSRQFKNFIEGYFTNNKGNISSGYILKKDLVLLKPASPKAMR